MPHNARTHEVGVSGVLSIVATPIGNLEDITLRALRTLKEADVIACEDTRVTKKLLFRYDIEKPLLSYHQHSGRVVYDVILGKLLDGKNVAVVTDAGTPGIADPGNMLVAAALEKGISVVPIPGVSAIATLASVAGIDMQRFVFLGFPPHKKGRKTFFERVAASDIPVMYYDSPHRVVKNLILLQEKKPTAHVVVGRELTKRFEEIRHGTVEELIESFQEHPEKMKGEFSLIVEN